MYLWSCQREESIAKSEPTGDISNTEKAQFMVNNELKHYTLQPIIRLKTQNNCTSAIFLLKKKKNIAIDLNYVVL